MAGLVYSLTSYQRPSQSERVIQALIFTFIVKVFVTVERWICEWVGKQGYVAGEWTSDIELVMSAITAIFLGLILAILINTDSLYSFLQKIRVTKRSSHPSEWCQALSTYPRFVVLGLKDERRISGWPRIWPSDPEKGHFYLVDASWETKNRTIDLIGCEGILLDVKDVKFVEFLQKKEGAK